MIHAAHRRFPRLPRHDSKLRRQHDGLLLDGVRDDSPAAKAGLKAGDQIVKIGTRDVKNVYDYTYALGEMKAGQEYVVEVMRGSEKLTLKISLKRRK